MSRALVLGGGGFVGGYITRGLLNAGWSVTITSRNPDAVEALRTLGASVLQVSSATDLSAWESEASKCALIVEAIGDKQDKSTAATVCGHLVSLLKRRPSLNVVYVAGVFSYGQDDSNPQRVFTEEDDSFDHCFEASKARVLLERQYRAAGGIVVSPGVVYGGGGPIAYTIADPMTAALKSGATVSVPSTFGNGKHFWSTVHGYDLGNLVALVAKSAATLRGQIINAVAHIERMDVLCDAVAASVGYKGTVAFPKPAAGDLRGQAYGGNIRVSGRRARTLLGWAPIHDPAALYVLNNH